LGKIKILHPQKHPISYGYVDFIKTNYRNQSCIRLEQTTTHIIVLYSKLSLTVLRPYSNANLS